MYSSSLPMIITPFCMHVSDQTVNKHKTVLNLVWLQLLLPSFEASAESLSPNIMIVLETMYITHFGTSFTHQADLPIIFTK